MSGSRVGASWRSVAAFCGAMSVAIAALAVGFPPAASARAAVIAASSSSSTCNVTDPPSVTVAPSGGLLSQDSITGRGFAAETKHILLNTEAGAVLLAESPNSASDWSADVFIPSSFEVPIKRTVTGSSALTVPLRDGIYQMTVIGETCGDGVSLDVDVVAHVVQAAQSSSANATKGGSCAASYPPVGLPPLRLTAPLSTSGSSIVGQDNKPFGL